MKQVVLINENGKLTAVGVVSNVDDGTLDQLINESIKNYAEKENRIKDLEDKLAVANEKIEKIEKELAYNRGEITKKEYEK